MKINIFGSLLLISLVVFVSSQDDDSKRLAEFEKLFKTFIESAPLNNKTKEDLGKLFPLKGEGRKNATELLDKLTKLAKDAKPTMSAPLEDFGDDKPTTEATPKTPTEGTTAKPTEGTTAKPTEGTTAKPTEGTTEKPANTTTEAPNAGDVVKQFVMIVKDIKSTTKKTFTSIKDLIKNGFQGKPRQSLIKQLLNQLSDKNSASGKPIYVVVDSSGNVNVFNNPEDVIKNFKDMKKKDSDKKKDEADDEDDDDDTFEDILSFLDLDE